MPAQWAQVYRQGLLRQWEVYQPICALAVACGDGAGSTDRIDAVIFLYVQRQRRNLREHVGSRNAGKVGP